MSQLNAFTEVGDRALVTVTHCNSPVEFYCRLLSDNDSFSNLQTLIDQFVQSGATGLPEFEPNEFSGIVLVYSIIHNCWCRAQLLSCNRDKDLRPITAKVRLIDYGSIQMTFWNKEYVLASAPAINFFNNGQGFCFACSLGNIRPWNGNKQITNHEWSSYATFLLEKETKDRNLVLNIQNNNNSAIICDLLFHNTDPRLVPSLASHLVNEDVARFTNGSIQTSTSFFGWDNKENRCIV